MAVMNFTGSAEIDSNSIQKRISEKLKSSGLTDADGVKLGISLMTGANTAALGLWRNARHPAMRFPFHNPFGTEWNFARYRCLADPLPGPWNDKNGNVHRFAKYTQPPKSPTHAYFPNLTDWKTLALNTDRPLIITEGELKAASATAAGFPTIGLSGVWNYMASKAGIDFLPELEHIAWEGRSVYICYDSDAATNPDIERALIALASRLVSRGALTARITLPSLSKPEKTGLDDYLVACGPKSFQKLIDDAEEIQSWQYRYQQGASGPINNLANTVIALEYAPELQNIFAFDEMEFDIAVISPPPHCNIPTPRSLRESDAYLIQSWLQREGGLARIGTETVRNAISLVAPRHKFHPIRDWLKNLEWDKTPRLNFWLPRYLGAADNSYTRAVGSMFLISMIARVCDPGCKVDHVLVLESPQGQQKSTICALLSGAAWFSDQLPDLGGHDEKRLSAHLRGKWVVEIAELSAIRKADIEEVKKFVTRRVEKYIPAYGRVQSVEPRQCVFIGTTNAQKYLRDDTGNRRWWPVAILDLDTDLFISERDQLFAEAHHRYHAGEKWWPEKEFETKVIQAEQDIRLPDEDWIIEIQEFTDKQMSLVLTADTGGRELRKYSISTSEISSLALGIEVRQRTTDVSRRIARTLERMNWRKIKVDGFFRYKPPETLVDDMLLKRFKAKTTPKVVPLKPAAKKY